MEDFFKHLETLGVSFSESRAAGDYGRAATQDELYFAAGEHLAAHATAVVESLGLQIGCGSHDAFCLAALADLCAVRKFLKERDRWPELSPLLDRIFVMACAHRSRAMDLSEGEQSAFYDRATDYLMDFQDDNDRTPESQVDRLMNLEGIARDRMDLPAFIKGAFIAPSWIDPWAVVKNHDRLADVQLRL